MEQTPLYQTSFGKVEVEVTLEIGRILQSRTITLQNAALSISGVTVSALIFDTEVQGNLLPDAASDFEENLLSEPHSFTWHDMKKLENQYNFSKYFSTKYWKITFFLENSEDIWFTVRPSDEKRHAFVLDLWDANSDELDPSYTCEVGVGKNGDILVRALEIACSLAYAIRGNGLDAFLTKLKLLSA